MKQGFTLVIRSMFKSSWTNVICWKQNLAQTLMTFGKRLSALQGEVLENSTMYGNTQSDIAFSVNYLSHFLSIPTLEHLKAVKSVALSKGYG